MCNCPQEPINCPPVLPVLPACSNPTFCAEIIYTKCVIYKGPALTNLGVVDGEDLSSILTKINALLSDGGGA